MEHECCLLITPVPHLVDAAAGSDDDLIRGLARPLVWKGKHGDRVRAGDYDALAKVLFLDDVALGLGDRLGAVLPGFERTVAFFDRHFTLQRVAFDNEVAFAWEVARDDGRLKLFPPSGNAWVDAAIADQLAGNR
jgi:hypothetical protein